MVNTIYCAIHVLRFGQSCQLILCLDLLKYGDALLEVGRILMLKVPDSQLPIKVFTFLHGPKLYEAFLNKTFDINHKLL